jgi:hypothetical protein
MYELDFSTADCIIVMGTSLKVSDLLFLILIYDDWIKPFWFFWKVEPFSNLIQESKENVPRLLINKESVGPFKSTKFNSKKKDFQILGDLIFGIESLADKLGWKLELDELIESELKNIVIYKIYHMLHMGHGKNYMIFLPQSWIDIFLLWNPIKLEFLSLFCHIVIEHNGIKVLTHQKKTLPHFENAQNAL